MNDFRKTRAQAEAYFRAKFPHLSFEESEDFGSWCVEQWLKGRETMTSFGFLAVDYFRLASMEGISDRRSNLMSRGGAITDQEAAENILRNLPAQETKSTDWTSLLPETLSIQERVSAILFYEYGLSQIEISRLFGVTPSRASQWISAVSKKIPPQRVDS